MWVWRSLGAVALLLLSLSHENYRSPFLIIQSFVVLQIAPSYWGFYFKYGRRCLCVLWSLGTGADAGCCCYGAAHNYILIKFDKYLLITIWGRCRRYFWFCGHTCVPVSNTGCCNPTFLEQIGFHAGTDQIHQIDPDCYLGNLFFSYSDGMRLLYSYRPHTDQIQKFSCPKTALL